MGKAVFMRCSLVCVAIAVLLWVIGVYVPSLSFTMLAPGSALSTDLALVFAVLAIAYKPPSE